MKLNFIFIIFVFCFNFGFSQNLSKIELDSLYNELITIHSHKQQMPTIESSGYIKCGFGLIATIKSNLNRFTPEQQVEIKKILQRPVLQTSIVTPSGNFRIHFDTIGSNIANYSISELAVALDSAYNFEVNFLGYPPAPADGTEGGDDKYDIYVMNLGNEYGETDTDAYLGSNKYTTYMEIVNDFNGFYTQGIDAARVTVAHEYFHAIQIGNYIFRYDQDGFFYEISSTAMEDFVYSSINDYYAYLPAYFKNAENTFACFSCGGGHQPYALSIWNIFMKERFGYDIIKRQWELMPQMRALNAINNSILERGSTYRKEFNLFGTWLFYTGYRSINGQYFSEAKNYPLLKPESVFDDLPQINGSAHPTSQNYMRVINKNNFDTLDVIISNSDYLNGIDSLNAFFPYQYSIFDSPVSGSHKLTDSYYTSFYVSDFLVWSETDILNNNIIRQDTTIILPSSLITEYAFPDPFRYNKNEIINITVKANTSEKVDINIYTASMELVYSASLPVLVKKYPVVTWNGKKSNGDKLTSGVYIYYAKSGSGSTTGKIVILDE